jgi:hypothetical protein
MGGSQQVEVGREQEEEEEEEKYNVEEEGNQEETVSNDNMEHGVVVP